MNEEIEKLKRERDEILAKVGELDRLTRDPESGINWPQVHSIFEELEALRPEPERLRGWANIYPSKITGAGFLYESEETAKKLACSSLQTLRIAVPMIEVRPLPELPEMEEWESVGDEVIERDHREHIAYALDPRMALKISDAHNAAIRDFKAWAETVKKEVGDE